MVRTNYRLVVTGLEGHAPSVEFRQLEVRCQCGFREKAGGLYDALLKIVNHLQAESLRVG